MLSTRSQMHAEGELVEDEPGEDDHGQGDVGGGIDAQGIGLHPHPELTGSVGAEEDLAGEDRHPVRQEVDARAADGLVGVEVDGRNGVHQAEESTGEQAHDEGQKEGEGVVHATGFHQDVGRGRGAGSDGHQAFEGDVDHPALLTDHPADGGDEDRSDDHEDGRKHSNNHTHLIPTSFCSFRLSRNS